MILFVGEETPSSESIIAKMSRLPIIGRIDLAADITKSFVAHQADRIKDELKNFING